MLFGFLILGIGIIGFISYFISAKAYSSLQRNQNAYARAIQVLIFLVSFSLLTLLALYIILSNIHLER